jgi:hypothetical protein
MQELFDETNLFRKFTVYGFFFEARAAAGGVTTNNTNQIQMGLQRIFARGHEMDFFTGAK